MSCSDTVTYKVTLHCMNKLGGGEVNDIRTALDYRMNLVVGLGNHTDHRWGRMGDR